MELFQSMESRIDGFPLIHANGAQKGCRKIFHISKYTFFTNKFYQACNAYWSKEIVGVTSKIRQRFTYFLGLKAILPVPLTQNLFSRIMQNCRFLSFKTKNDPKQYLILLFCVLRIDISVISMERNRFVLFTFWLSCFVVLDWFSLILCSFLMMVFLCLSLFA